MLRNICGLSVALALFALVGCGGGSSNEVASTPPAAATTPPAAETVISAPATPEAPPTTPEPESPPEQPTETPAATPETQPLADKPAETTPENKPSDPPAEGQKPAESTPDKSEEKPADTTTTVAASDGLTAAPPQFAEGSPEKVLYEFVTQLAAGGFADLGKLISKKATGPLKSIRDNKVGEEETEQLKTLLSKVRISGAPRTIQGTTIVGLETEDGRKIQFELAKEDGKIVVTKMTLPKNLAPAKKPAAAKVD